MYAIHVHAIASCAQTRRPRNKNKTQASHEQLSSPWQSCITEQQNPKNTFRRKPTWPSRKQTNYCTAQPFPESCVEGNGITQHTCTNRKQLSSDWGGHLASSHWNAKALSKGVLRKWRSSFQALSGMFMFLIHVHNSCSCNLNFLLASCAQTRRPRNKNKTQASHEQLSSPWQSCITEQQHPRTLSEDSPHDHPESKQITVQYSHFQKAVCKGTELRSTHAQTESSFRQTGAVTWHLLTEMQKHSPKVS